MVTELCGHSAGELRNFLSFITNIRLSAHHWAMHLGYCSAVSFVSKAASLGHVHVNAPKSFEREHISRLHRHDVSFIPYQYDCTCVLNGNTGGSTSCIARPHTVHVTY